MSDELARLSGIEPDGQPASGFLVELRVICSQDAAGVLDRARQVFRTVVESQDPWPSLEAWRSILPEWFVNTCASEMTDDQAKAWVERWRALPQEERARVTREQRWSLGNWLYWMEPEQRQWWWWSADLNSEIEIRLAIHVDGWPVAHGALDWALKAAGALEILDPAPK